MSRVGRQPIDVAKGVTVDVQGSTVTVKGPKGTLTREMSPDISITQADGQLIVTRPSDQKEHRALHGLTRALLNNMVTGVTTGFTKSLELQGVGYRAQKNGNNVTLAVGYSHPVVYELPKGVSAKVDKNVIILMSSDREILGETAAKVRSFRPPEPYKGKGVKYANEVIARKEAKKK